MSRLSITLFAILSMIFLLLITNCGQPKTDVLVIGTIHRGHYNNPNYSYDNIIQIISTYNPDIVCVEIHPKDFRNNSTYYPMEMIASTIWGFNNNKKVYPIDWWDEDNNDRMMRNKLALEPEYIEKQKMADSLAAENKLMQEFDVKYGNIENTYQEYKSDFWNGSDYNNFVKETYKISMQVFGDSPFNLHYQSRNQNMLKLIEDAINENKCKKLIVITGSEHKHFFDDALSLRSDVSLLELNSILPINETEIDTEIVEFLSTRMAKSYYDFGTSEGIDGYYISVLMPLLHAPQMDFKPEIISEENIKKAKIMLDEWQEKNPESINLQFELGWYNFIISSYKESIEHSEIVTQNLDKIVHNEDFIKSIVYRNIGLCYDKLEKPEIAIECYKKGVELIEETKYAEMKQLIYQDVLSDLE